MTVAARTRITRAIAKLENAALASQALFRSRYGRSEDDGDSPCFVKLKKLSGSKIARIEKQLANEHAGFTLPATYRWFLASYGLLQVWHGRPPNGAEVMHMFAPEMLGSVIDSELDTSASIDRCIAFQFISDADVENYFAFYLDAKTRSGELPIVSYYHDESFDLPKRAKPLLATDFASHLVACCDDIHADYLNDYDP